MRQRSSQLKIIIFTVQVLIFLLALGLWFFLSNDFNKNQKPYYLNINSSQQNLRSDWLNADLIEMKSAEELPQVLNERGRLPETWLMTKIVAQLKAQHRLPEGIYYIEKSSYLNIYKTLSSSNTSRPRALRVDASKTIDENLKHNFPDIGEEVFASQREDYLQYLQRKYHLQNLQSINGFFYPGHYVIADDEKDWLRLLFFDTQRVFEKNIGKVFIENPDKSDNYYRQLIRASYIEQEKAIPKTLPATPIGQVRASSFIKALQL